MTNADLTALEMTALRLLGAAADAFGGDGDYGFLSAAKIEGTEIKNAEAFAALIGSLIKKGLVQTDASIVNGKVVGQDFYLDDDALDLLEG